jgi:hypothetical protein
MGLLEQLAELAAFGNALRERPPARALLSDDADCRKMTSRAKRTLRRHRRMDVHDPNRPVGLAGKK